VKPCIGVWTAAIARTRYKTSISLRTLDWTWDNSIADTQGRRRYINDDVERWSSRNWPRDTNTTEVCVCDPRWPGDNVRDTSKVTTDMNEIATTRLSPATQPVGRYRTCAMKESRNGVENIRKFTTNKGIEMQPISIIISDEEKYIHFYWKIIHHRF